MRYPLFLDLTGQPVVVVGAGRVATRKIRSLLAAGARVTVASPTATPAIRQLARRNRIRWLQRRYRRGDLRGARLVVAATNNPETNGRVCAEANRRRLLVNCVAPPAAGNFIVPSVVRRGGVLLAISTGGASPGFAKRLRSDLERFLGDGYPALLTKMAKQRRARVSGVGRNAAARRRSRPANAG
ncbi:MAG TPA: bifunctional precorrin-2 dehydrogenase/sirohydrochlorin ferrochelatase [Verrucomicrobiae bacterium]|nr:bifunctional precorrin-2 dehydrogenase/sirohydrochlorin ferrochelatase [Verrucomicrobiae bacterium]